jgi:MerR family transcriptional regulator, heat shock protein HspR
VTYYTRRQIVEILEVEEEFVLALEREEVIFSDAPGGADRPYSERMLERVRVADNLVHDLEVNLPGAAVIVRLREEMAMLQHRMSEFARELERLRGR